jgi:hypothetical protein
MQEGLLHKAGFGPLVKVVFTLLGQPSEWLGGRWLNHRSSGGDLPFGFELRAAYGQLSPSTIAFSMSLIGTERTWRSGRDMSVIGNSGRHSLGPSISPFDLIRTLIRIPMSPFGNSRRRES